MGIQFEFFRLASSVGDWANWDDTYQFIQDNNSDYLEANLVPQALQNLNINLILFADSDGTILVEMAYNLSDMTEIPLDISQITTKYFTLLHPESEEDTVEGIIQLAEGPMLVASSPILTSDGQGPARGVMVFGRFLDDEEITFLSQMVGLPVDLRNVDDPNMPPDFLEAHNSLTTEITMITIPLNETSIAGFSIVTDLNEKPISLIRVINSREEYIQTKTSVSFLGISIGLIGLVLIIVIMLLLDKFVMSRLASLTGKVEKLRLDGKSTTRFDYLGNDEITVLARKISGMVDAIRLAQSSLEDYAVNLEKKVIDKTEMLVETQKMLLQSERLAVIGQMAAMVAHDLRNPLFGIKNALFYLRKGAVIQKNKQDLKMLDLIDESINNANKIVNDLLDFSREIKLEKESIKLETLVSNSLLSNRPPDRIHVMNMVDPSIDVNVDISKFNRIFINLISNAVEAMPDGGVLEIKSIVKGESVDVSFADTGIGITPENLDKMWKPLFTTKTKGMGLGLVICKRFAEAHGGGIRVTSEEGKGAVFIVSIPIVPGKQSV